MTTTPQANTELDRVMARHGLTVGCNACTGVFKYRVRMTHPNGLDADNFDQLVDHASLLASDVYLRTKCDGKGSITILRLGMPAHADMQQRLQLADVVGYAGPDPFTGARSWWSETSPEGDPEVPC